VYNRASLTTEDTWTMIRSHRLRQLINTKQGLVVPGAYDGVSAKLVERAGYPVAYMTGYGVSASRLGLPDMGFAGLAEMADQARNMAAAVSIPLIADADTGYGNALTVRRTIALYEAAGVAGLHLEDQQLPKRCGHLAGKLVVPVEEFAAKIRAAVEARTDPDLVIIARTDAIAVNGFDDALRRAEAAVKAGADMLFVEAPTTSEQIERVARAFDTPVARPCCPSPRSASSATPSSCFPSTPCSWRRERSSVSSSSSARATPCTRSRIAISPSASSTS
jgi:2-methylisocitrate lyase-like PEP mutase family enzyme